MRPAGRQLRQCSPQRARPAHAWQGRIPPGEHHSQVGCVRSDAAAAPQPLGVWRGQAACWVRQRAGAAVLRAPGLLSCRRLCRQGAPGSPTGPQLPAPPPVTAGSRLGQGRTRCSGRLPSTSGQGPWEPNRPSMLASGMSVSACANARSRLTWGRPVLAGWHAAATRARRCSSSGCAMWEAMQVAGPLRSSSVTSSSHSSQAPSYAACARSAGAGRRHRPEPGRQLAGACSEMVVSPARTRGHTAGCPAHLQGRGMHAPARLGVDRRPCAQPAGTSRLQGRACGVNSGHAACGSASAPSYPHSSHSAATCAAVTPAGASFRRAATCRASGSSCAATQGACTRAGVAACECV